MAQRREIAAIYSAAIIQGVVLVTFPATGAIFTSRAYYGFSATEYGGMFVPQAIAAILSSLLGAGLTRRIGGKRVLIAGLAADLLSMLLLLASQLAMGRHGLAYGLLLGATGALGIGFGFAVPALNLFTARFHPKNVDAAILTLNALLGLGTVLAPVFAAVFVGFGVWWGLSVLMSVLTFALVVFALPLPLRMEADGAGAARRSGGIPGRFWLFAAFALIYGVCETMNGNWATIFMSGSLGASAALSSVALTLFWTAVTAGRVLFAAIEKWAPQRWTYRLLPFVIAIAFLITVSSGKGHVAMALCSFAVAGLGCSALLPLVISFGQEQLTSMPASVAGALIGFYQIGYGMAAFGVGPLHNYARLALGSVFGWTAALALLLAGLSWAITTGVP